MVRLTLLACFAFALPVVAQDDATKKLQDAMQGDWKPHKAIKGGIAIPEDKIAESTFKVSGGSMDMHTGDDVQKATFKLDASKKPAHFDLDAGGKNLNGIVRIEGDTLTLVLGLKDRPTAFESGNDTVYIEMKKAKK